MRKKYRTNTTFSDYDIKDLNYYLKKAYPAFTLRYVVQIADNKPNEYIRKHKVNAKDIDSYKTFQKIYDVDEKLLYYIGKTYLIFIKIIVNGNDYIIMINNKLDELDFKSLITFTTGLRKQIEHLDVFLSYCVKKPLFSIGYGDYVFLDDISKCQYYKYITSQKISKILNYHKEPDKNIKIAKELTNLLIIDNNICDSIVKLFPNNLHNALYTGFDRAGKGKNGEFFITIGNNEIKDDMIVPVLRTFLNDKVIETAQKILIEKI